MNGSLTFSMEIIYYMVAIFVPNETPSCSLRFVQFASTFSITTLCFLRVFSWLTMLSYIVCQSFGFHLPYCRVTSSIVLRTSDQMYPCFTSGINNDQTVHDTQINVYIQMKDTV